MAHIKNQHTYSLKNSQAGTNIDLFSGDEDYSVIGFRPHDGSSQAWIFQQDGDQSGWFIKSSHSGKYLGIEGKSKNGTAVVVVSNPFKWDVKDSNVGNTKGIKILVPGTKFGIDLFWGLSANHTKVQLWESDTQIWMPTERVSIKDQQTYILRNRQGGTAVDLSSADNYSITGYHPHDGSNQAWIFQRVGDQNGWFIKSSRSGQYLGIEGNADNGTRVVAVPSPFRWDIEDSDIKGTKGIRILAHGTNFSLELSNNGSPANRTKIQLWGSWHNPHQIWAPVERASI